MKNLKTNLFIVAVLIYNTAMASIATTKVLTITAERDDFYSVMHIGEHPQAHNAAKQGEDAKLLMYDASMTPFGIYSLSEDNAALSVNVLQNFEIVPIACHIIDNSDDANIVLMFDGTDNFPNRDLSLFDSYTGNSTLITNDLQLMLENSGNDIIRYYVFATEKTASSKITTDLKNTTDETVRVGMLGNGSILLNATETITGVFVYALNGQLVYAQQQNTLSTEFSLPQGMYVLDIETETGKQYRKIRVK